MTREEASFILANIDRRVCDDELNEALDMAIKALEQEPILDKIRAEIMELDYDIETIGFDLNDMPQTEMIHTVCREEVLRIIDKHKAESEVNNG